MTEKLDVPIAREPNTFTPSRRTVANIRVASVALLGSGLTALTYGAVAVGTSHWFAALLVPVFLGVVGGVTVWNKAHLIKMGLTDPVEWIRSGVIWLVIAIMIGRTMVPRLQPGVGYIMAGTAFAVAAVGLYKTFVVATIKPLR